MADRDAKPRFIILFPVVLILCLLIFFVPYVRWIVGPIFPFLLLLALSQQGALSAIFKSVAKLRTVSRRISVRISITVYIGRVRSRGSHLR